MSFDLRQFSRTRPFLYHLTQRSNLSVIMSARRLDSAAVMFEKSGEPFRRREHRRQPVLLRVGSTAIHVRDQAPLKRGNVVTSPEWAFEDLLELLNERVFFWPGGQDGPIKSGRNHFERYQNEDVVVIRMPTEDLFEANPDHEPEFCRWNSGAPRWVRGRPPSRGPLTFQRCAEAPYTAGAVVEVTYRNGVVLPQTTIVWGA